MKNLKLGFFKICFKYKEIYYSRVCYLNKIYQPTHINSKYFIKMIKKRSN